MAIPDSQADEFREKIAREESVLSSWEQLPEIEDMRDILAICSVFLNDNPEKKEIMTAMVVFTEQFTIWQGLGLGEEQTIEDIETMVSGESLVLELSNDWYRRFSGSIQPVLMECRACMTTVRIIRSVGDKKPESLDEEVQIVWAQYVRMWDFIPWFMFLASGSITLYTSIKVLMSRYTTCARPEFERRYRNL